MSTIRGGFGNGRGGSGIYCGELVSGQLAAFAEYHYPQTNSPSPADRNSPTTSSLYRVIVAQDGAEALRLVEFARPDLILLDAMLPGMDGSQVWRRLKARDSSRDIPVIFMTALKQTESKLSTFMLGAVDYVTKSLQIDELIARVGMHFSYASSPVNVSRLAPY